MCYPLIELVADVDESPTGVLYYFGGYAGYFVLGHVLLRYPHVVRWSWLSPLLFLSLAAPVACKLMHWQVDFYRMFWYLSVFAAVMCVAWFKGAVEWSGHLFRDGSLATSVIVLLSKLSFGVYLVHFFVLREVLWNQRWLLEMESSILQSLLLAVLTFVISVVISFLLSLLPFGQYITGCRLRFSKSLW